MFQWIFFCCLLFVPPTVFAQGDSALNSHDQNVICVNVNNCSTFCQAAGEADDGCKHLASTVNGNNPSCCAAGVCEFTQNGKKAFISTKEQPGTTKYKSCHKGVSIISEPSSCGGSPSNSSCTPTPSPPPPKPPSHKSSTTTCPPPKTPKTPKPPSHKSSTTTCSTPKTPTPSPKTKPSSTTTCSPITKTKPSSTTTCSPITKTPTTTCPTATN